jgi:drug/metabolite transporter (DMT)-like permease
VTTEGSAPRAYLPLVGAVLCASVGSIFVRLAQSPPLTVSFYRVFLASLLLAPLALPGLLRAWPSLPRARRLLLLGCGSALALHFASWIASLSLTSVAASVLLVNLAPVFNVVLSRLFLGETPAPTVLAALAVALAGAGLIAAQDWSSGGPSSLVGDALALAGALALSVYHVIGRGLRNALPLDTYVLAVWGSAAAVLGLLCLAFQSPLLGLPPRAFGWFLALAIVPTLGGHGLMNLSLRRLPAPVVGLFLLGEPVGASALAYVLLGEVPGTLTLAGGLVVLAGLGFLVFGGRS